MSEWLSEIDWVGLATQALIIALQIILIFIVFSIIKSIGKRLITSWFERMSAQRNMSAGRAKTLEKLAINVFTYILWFVLATIIIGLLDYDVTALI
ncbi:mechanosensitive ion channel protein, partial [Pseudomonas sp. 2822-15]